MEENLKSIGEISKSENQKDVENINSNLTLEEQQRLIDIRKELDNIQASQKVLNNRTFILEHGLNKYEDSTNPEYIELMIKLKAYRSELLSLNWKEKNLNTRINELQNTTQNLINELAGVEEGESISKISIEDKIKFFQEADKALKGLESTENMSNEVKDALKDLAEKGLENLSAGEVYMMKQEGYDLSKLFLLSDKGRLTGKDDIKEGNILTVNFGRNRSIDMNIGAGDLLPIDRIYEVKINGISGKRGFDPRPGFYTEDGEYLAIHDGYSIEIIKEKPYEPGEKENFEKSAIERFKEFRSGDISSWITENLSSINENRIIIPFKTNSDIDLFNQYLVNYFPEKVKNNLEFDKSTKVFKTKDGKSLGEVMKDNWQFYPKGEKLLQDQAFMNKLNEVCDYLGVKIDHLLIVMRAESGISTSIVNPLSRATGLIQFMPNTAISLGTTVSQLRMMSGVEQLEYVKKYFQPYKGRLNSVYDLYTVTFFPAALGKSKSEVFHARGISASSVTNANKGIAKFSTRPDGNIDGYAFERYVNSLIS